MRVKLNRIWSCLLVIFLLYIEFKNYDNLFYEELIREKLNNIYITGYYLNIMQFIYVVTIYTLIMYDFISLYSKELDRYKVIVKWKSENIVRYYYNIVSYFFKKLLYSFIVYLLIFSSIYSTALCYSNIKDIILGSSYLLKIFIIFFWISLLGLILKVKKIARLAFCYIGIILYLVVLQNIALIYYIFITFVMIIVYIIFVYSERGKDI